MTFRLPGGAACLFLLTATAFGFVPAEETNDEPAAKPVTSGNAGPSGYDPPIQPASDEAERALSAFRVPEGMEASLIAAEPLLANPVSFWIDNQGRYWVCETFRQGNAVVDNRGRDYWLLDDLAAQTVEDRLAYHQKHLGEEGLKAFTEHDDRIRLLTDLDGDGKVDKATVFADGFNSPMEGTGAGVLTHGDSVYYTNIPHLWRLKDQDGDGVADERDSLASGFGVRVAFRGHDMHGLVMGPDGRLYFSIGDRGFNVVTQEGESLAMPDRGAVFRCEPDGSHLEVFASGLRNPQELAFDDYGNLFTGDNNSDSGDKARWVYVAEGSDSGWRMYYQYLDDRGPWNREMMWYPHDSPPLENEGPGGVPKGTVAKEVQPAYVLPPVLNLGDGPSGLTYYPGVGLGERYKNHFFLCDFRGTPSNSGVRSFAVEPKGAGFKVVDSHEFIWSILCTDADFAPDGTFVIADWVNGWNGEGKGRLYGFKNPEQAKAGAESAKLLAEDFSERTAEELIGLFSHADRRVRQKAQFELAKRPLTDWSLAERVFEKGSEIEQLHLVWAYGQRARQGELESLVASTLRSQIGSEQVRAQSLKMLGDVFERGPLPNGKSDQETYVVNLAAAKVSVARQLDHESPVVRAQALIALGKSGEIKVSGGVRSLAKDPEDARKDEAAWKAAANPTQAILSRMSGLALADRVLWNAGTVALAKLGDVEELLKAERLPSASARLAAVVALRKMEHHHVALFLGDEDPDVVAEAARAINDVPIDGGNGALAALVGRGDRDLDRTDESTLRRVLNANFRAGTRDNAETVAKLASNSDVSIALRLEALAELKLWNEPPKTDRVTGMYRPVGDRNADFIVDVVEPMLGELLGASDGRVRKAAIELATVYRIQGASDALRAIALDATRGDAERIAALEGLTVLEADDLNAILAKAVEDESAEVRSEARSLWAEHDPEAAVPVLDQAIAEGETVEKQSAITALANLKIDAADAVLARWFDKFASGQTPPEVGLELVEAAAKRESLKGRLDAYESGHADGAAAWQVALSGGDAERGRDIFFNRASVSCQRCHKAEDGRGGEVGPDLSKIGEKKDRAYLLEAMIAPNAKIAEGFESVIVVTSEGQVVTGVKRAETETELTLITAEGKGIVIPKEEIEDQAVGKSAMPEDIVQHLSKRDMRDLVEFLANQK